jgi:hypothetical protein
MKFCNSKTCRGLLLFGALHFSVFSSNLRAEALLQLFNVSYVDLIQKMPELAEAGYTALWLPPPTKGSGGLSVGYDMWDPFDFGQKDQRNTVRTRYGTEAELLQMMEVAHRFGIRVYFDNIMNHRAFDIPGFNETTPTGGEGQTELYPGMVPEDFHLQKTEDGFYRKWNNTRDWNSAWQVQNLGLSDLIDIAHESPNANFGKTEGSTHPKYSFVRDLNRPEQYDKDKDGNTVYFGWLIDRARAALGTNATSDQLREHAKAYILTNRPAYVEDVGAYLIRAARWKIDRTKADGFRLDAVKHVPDYFFGQMSGGDKNNSDAGYLGAVQRQFNLTRGFSDANHRDSVFDEKRSRDDAMLFGEHLGQPPGYSGYVDAGMRLVDNDLRSKLNSQLGNPWGTLAGLDSPGAGGFSASVGVTHANSHDNDYAALKEMQHAHYMFREGIGLIYSDGYYKAGTLGESGGAFPRHANTQFLGQFADPRIPNILKLHNDFARGLQQGRWGDSDYMAYERRDNRDKFGNTRSGTASEEITMVAMFNDNTAQGQARQISTSFGSGAYLYQYAEGPNGSYMGGFYKYAGELGSVVVPPGGYYLFGWRTPELSTLWPNAAISLYQNGVEVDRITVTRKDGPDGDKNFNPYNLPNRGYPVGITPPDYTYQTTVPVVKSGNFTIVARADGSAENIVLKLDGGVDLNGTRPDGNTDPAFRDHPPGIFSDVWMGYEQPLFQHRQHPELFAAKVTNQRDVTGSTGAETFTTGGVLNEATSSKRVVNANTAQFFYHDPTATADSFGFNQYDAASRRLWSKVNSVGGGYKMFVYYTTDTTYYPEGAGGVGVGRTRVAEMTYQADQSSGGVNWWASTAMPSDFTPGVSRYKIGVFKTGASSVWPSGPGEVEYKKLMLTSFRVENFNPSSVDFFPHNDYARTPTLGQPYASWPLAKQTGLSEGFHFLRARAHLNRNANTSAPLYQTFTQVFYYDATPPTGEVLYPSENGNVGGSSYEIVVHTDKTVEEVWFNIADSDNGNNDTITKILNGNGPGFEPFVDANQSGVRDTGEEYTDVNANGVYDATLTQSWGQATQVTTVNLPNKKEWRFRYNNIPSTGTADITLRLLEASSARDIDLDASTARVTEIVRRVTTAGPDQRINIAWPQRDGDRVDDNYTMKVYFTKSLADGTNLESLKNRFTFSIASTENGTDREAVAQSRDNFTINYNINGTFHELAIPLPNLYNDVPDFLHTLKVTYTFPDNRQLEAVCLAKANPSAKPFVRITRPSELGSDGRPTEITLPDGPGPDTLYYVVRMETSVSVNDLQLTGTPAITLFIENFTDTNANDRWDDQEPSTDKNGNGQLDGDELYQDVNSNGKWDLGEPLTDRNGNGLWDSAETFTDVDGDGIADSGELFSDTNGNKVRDPAEPFADDNNNGTWDGPKVTTAGQMKSWDYTWKITNPGNYLLTATATLNGQSTSTVRNARIIQRQITTTDEIQDNDDDNDGLIDLTETNKKDLPETNPETWSNGSVHVWYASGQTLPNSPDSDGDLLPDALEVGWRVASNPPTTPGIDTNQDGIPNFIADLDPPFYAVAGNNGKVPGVGSLNQGDDRTRQATGSVTDPNNSDTDNDGISDGIEDANRNGWADGDGQSIDPTWDPWLARAWPNNIVEAGETWTETSPTKADSDGDGLSDGTGEDKNSNGKTDLELLYADGSTKLLLLDLETDTSVAIAGSAYRSGLAGSRAINYGQLLGNKTTNQPPQIEGGFYRADGTGFAQTNGWPKIIITETDPLNSDTDRDGLPDGWESQYGLNPLDDGTYDYRTGGLGNPANGASGDPDTDGVTNATELTNGTNPNQMDSTGGGTGEGSLSIGTFTGWDHDDLLVLDEYNEGNSNGGADVYRSNNGSDNSRDIVAFSFRDGGETSSGGDGRLYFRIDFLDLAPFAEEGEVDAYVVIDTGNPGAGERSIPNEIDIATDMKWEVVVAAYGKNFGNIFVDKNSSLNTMTQTQNPVTAGGVEARGFGGQNEIAWSSVYDAVEIAVERRHLKDAGWLGDPNTLNFQVFTTKPNTTGTGTGDLASRNDIRDTIYDDYLASDWWRDQDNIILNGKLSGYFGRSGSNDRNKNAKVVLLAHGNQAIQPTAVTQALTYSGSASNSVGYHRLIQSHQTHDVPLTLHVTPTLASALQWAVNPTPGSWPNNDGPSLNQKIKSMVTDGRIDLVGSTFADHVPKYFPDNFNIANRQIADEFLNGIYGSVSSNLFWASERVLDNESINAIKNMGYSYVFADQMRHFVKWFGRSEALGTGGYRINEVSGIKVFPIHDATSEYLDQTLDGGSPLAVRQLLSRRARSNPTETEESKKGYQDQVLVLWKDLGDFANTAKASSYDANIRWLGSRPWIRVVTAQQIIDQQISYIGRDGNISTNWGTESRGAEQNLTQTAKDWVDWASRENYDNWFNNLTSLNLGANSAFGRVGVSGHANSAWSAISDLPTGNLQKMARAVIGGAMFQTAFHLPNNNQTTDLTKFSTGDYINPANLSQQALANFARHSHSQTRFAKLYERVQLWTSSATNTTLGSEAADVDLDGVNEYLLYNSRLFGVFETKGGRMTAAWMRNPTNGKVWQVAGNFAAYSNTDTEDEGSDNATAYRTSGFKDWWLRSTAGSDRHSVNTDYQTQATEIGKGWRFSNQNDVTKTITLASANANAFTAEYQLSSLNKAYIRFGLSPNLEDLLLRGQAGLESEIVSSDKRRVSVKNTSGSEVVRAFVEVSASAVINDTASDLAVAGTSVLRRNQAQTHQVEVELNGSSTTHVITFGFDDGIDTPNPDSDADDLLDSWENSNFGNLEQTASGDPDGDGVGNLIEMKLGSNPNSSASTGLPAPSVSGLTSTGFTITFPTVTGLNYQVVGTENLAGPSWPNIGDQISGTGEPQSVTDTFTTPPARKFYKVKITTP